MRFSTYLGMRLPERLPAQNDAADIDDLTYDIEAIDRELELQGQADLRLEQAKVNRTELSEHILKNVLEHPDDSVTDLKIGERSIGNTKGLLQALLAAVGDMFKAVTGEGTWNAAPKITLAQAKTHRDSKANPHGTTAEQTGAYTKAEVDNKLSTLETNIDWKEAVATYADISKAYISPQDGWTVNVKDTDYTYRYNGAEWVAISANAIPKATTALDGLMPKERVAEATANTAARHTHSNKALLDAINATVISSWNSVADKLSLIGGTLTGFLTLHAQPTATMHAATKKYVDDSVSALGGGDMLKTVYDKTNNGIVDNAEKVNNFTVLSSVPANAKFTDTVYSHPSTGVIAGTYKSVTVNAQGHVTAGTSPNTLDGYGVTDAYTKLEINTFLKNTAAALHAHNILNEILH